MRIFFRTLILLFTTINLMAYDFVVDNIYYNRIAFESESVEVTFAEYGASINSYSGSVIIPSTIKTNLKTYNVTSIGKMAFMNCSKLTSVSIPNSVTFIGQYAFSGCTRLDSIIIPDLVKSIGGSAFSGCSKFTSFTVPISVTSIGPDILHGCSFLTNLNFNAMYCTYVGSMNKGNAFDNIPNLKTLTLGDSVKIIPDYAFLKCTGITSLHIPNSVTSIGRLAFYGCSGLTSINIPNNVTSMGDNVFSGCTGLNSIFYNAKSCTFSSTPESLSPFHNLKNIKTITLGDSVRILPMYSFYGCTGLTSINIPPNVISIGDKAFSGCTGLTSVFYDAESCSFMGSTASRSAFNDLSNIKILKIGDNVKVLPSYAFYNCSGLSSLTIPNSVAIIGEYSFTGCSNLSSLTIPNSVTSIGKGAFQGSIELQKISLGESLVSLGSDNFNTSKKLTTINYNPKNLVDFLNSAGSNFYNLQYLDTIRIGKNVTSIAGYMFESCSSVRVIYCQAEKPPLIKGTTFYNTSKNIPLYVPINAITNYQSDPYWGEFSKIFEDKLSGLQLVGKPKDSRIKVWISDENLKVVSNAKMVSIEIFEITGNKLYHIEEETFAFNLPKNDKIIKILRVKFDDGMFCVTKVK